MAPVPLGVKDFPEICFPVPNFGIGHRIYSLTGSTRPNLAGSNISDVGTGTIAGNYSAFPAGTTLPNLILGLD